MIIHGNVFTEALSIGGMSSFTFTAVKREIIISKEVKK